MQQKQADGNSATKWRIEMLMSAKIERGGTQSDEAERRGQAKPEPVGHGAR